MRLTKIEYGSYLSLAARSRSEDPQTQTGCVLFDENWRVIGTGFNGFASKFVPSEDLIEDRDLKSDIISHAEVNAIINCSKSPKYLFSVLSPCVSCAKTISATTVKEVYYIKQYHKGGKVADEKFKRIFDLYNIKYRQIDKGELERVKMYFTIENSFLNLAINESSQI